HGSDGPVSRGGQHRHDVIPELHVEIIAIFPGTRPPLRRIALFLSAVGFRPVSLRKNPAYDGELLSAGMRGWESVRERILRGPVEWSDIPLELLVKQIIPPRETHQRSCPCGLTRAVIECVLRGPRELLDARAHPRRRTLFGGHRCRHD